MTIIIIIIIIIIDLLALSSSFKLLFTGYTNT